MTDWIDLPDYPRTFASQCAPWGSVVRAAASACTSRCSARSVATPTSRCPSTPP
ncbi:hypothetical protein [Nannocystis pusilla]|uniref:hypothetical protein n=1 Tax=Nannocystis pusilla TaxID=889268 RepID=UPI003BF14E97